MGVKRGEPSRLHIRCVINGARCCCNGYKCIQQVRTPEDKAKYKRLERAMLRRPGIVNLHAQCGVTTFLHELAWNIHKFNAGTVTLTRRSNATMYALYKGTVEAAMSEK